MINFNDVIKEDVKEYTPNWSQIPYQPYWIFIARGLSILRKLILMLKIHMKQNINF